MSDGKERLLAAVRASLGRGAADPGRRAAVLQRVDGRHRNLALARTALPEPELVALFVAMAEAAAASVERLENLGEVPDAVARYLAGRNLPTRIKMAPDPTLTALDWHRRPTLEVTTGIAEDPDLVSVTSALGAVAETGTLVLTSGPQSPTTLNFLPDHHIVVLRRDQVAATSEDIWDRVRADGALPRTVNFITGPSRTGDIEQTIQLGAHGPRRLHILLVDDAAISQSG